MTPDPARPLRPARRADLRAASGRCRRGAGRQGRHPGPAARHRHRQRALGYAGADRRLCRPPGNHPRFPGLPGRTVCPALPGHRLPRSVPRGSDGNPGRWTVSGGRCRTRPRPRRLGAAAPDVPRCRRAGHSALHPEPRRAGTGLPPGPGARAAGRQGFLVIASGNVTHNLRDYQLAARNGGQTPAYVREFPDWLADRLPAGDIAGPARLPPPGAGRRPGPPERGTSAAAVCLARVPVAKEQGCNASTPASTIA